MELREGILKELPAEAVEYITTLQRRYGDLETRYETLEEEYRLLVYRRCGRSAEQMDPDQRELFSEAESESPEVEDEPVVVAKHARRRRGRKPLDEHCHE